MDTAQTIKKIKDEYDRAVAANEKIVKLKAAAQTANQKYQAASKIASQTGMTTAEVLLSNLLELYPDGNIPEDEARALIRPTMEHNHQYVLENALDAQDAMNAEAEVGLKPVAPEFDTEQAEKIVETVTGYDDISQHKKDITKSIEMASRKTVDDTMRVNAEAHRNAGMDVSVTRIYDGIGVHDRKDRCTWCLSRCGTNMSYSEAIAKGAFARHPGCGCEIYYKTGKRILRQANWEKNSWDDDALQNRRNYGIGHSTNELELIKRRAYSEGKKFADTLEYRKKHRIDYSIVNDADDYVAPDGIVYKVNGSSVYLDYSTEEVADAHLIVNTLGGEIRMVPQVKSPEGIRTPDYIYNGDSLDRKGPNGSGKRTIKNNILAAKGQSSGVVLNITECQLSEEEIYSQLDGALNSPDCDFVKMLIVIKDNRITKMLERI